MAWNCSKIENIHWLNAFGYEMYCQFSFTVKMHQSIYKASTHRIMQFSLKIDIIVWSLSLSSIFFYQLRNVRKCITSLGIYLKQFHKEKYMAYQNRRIFHASLIITQQAMCVNHLFPSWIVNSAKIEGLWFSFNEFSPVYEQCKNLVSSHWFEYRYLIFLKRGQVVELI